MKVMTISAMNDRIVTIFERRGSNTLMIRRMVDGDILRERNRITVWVRRGLRILGGWRGWRGSDWLVDEG